MLSNEELTKLIVTLGALGYRIVSVNPEKEVIDSFGNKLESSRIALVITQVEKVSQ
jgi:hypothetical protein